MKSKYEEKIETPITSMIDIVFLLIIFFVVTSAIEQDAVDSNIRMAKSTWIKPVTQQDPRTIIVGVRKMPNDKVVYGVGVGGYIPLSQLEAVLINARLQYGNDVPVVIRASEDVQYAYVDRVTAKIGKAGLWRVKLAARHEEK